MLRPNLINNITRLLPQLPHSHPGHRSNGINDRLSHAY